ncbi:unnamed protein product, partial [Mesorhabditis spiculigera]
MASTEGGGGDTPQTPPAPAEETSRVASGESGGSMSKPPSVSKRLSCVEVTGAPPPLTIKKVTQFAIDPAAANPDSAGPTGTAQPGQRAHYVLLCMFVLRDLLIALARPSIMIGTIGG